MDVTFRGAIASGSDPEVLGHAPFPQLTRSGRSCWSMASHIRHDGPARSCEPEARIVFVDAEGAIISGGERVSTVKNGIIDPADIDDADVFVSMMMGALLGAAIRLSVATWMGAPSRRPTPSSVAPWAPGRSVGLALFGPKLIRTVGSEITEADRSRAFKALIEQACWLRDQLSTSDRPFSSREP